LTDVQAAAYAAFRGAPYRTDLERFFFLDDADRELIEGKRRSHNRLGFAVQLTTARYLGVFLDDATDVPAEVVDYLAEQLDIGDASVLKAYGERENTRLEHVRELRRVVEYKEFAEAEADLRTWVDARARTTGEGPKTLFDAAVGQLRERRVLLPGVTTPTRPVASVREASNQRLWDTLYGMLSVGQRAVTEGWFWIRTVGAPRDGAPRDGELHQSTREGATFAATQSRQNSLPSMSCITRHDSLSSSASRSRTRTAPSATSRAHSASSAARRSSPTSPVPTRTSRCSRFLTTLPSGTRWKNSRGPTPEGSMHANAEP
jgi:hypothetical protein